MKTFAKKKMIFLFGALLAVLLAFLLVAGSGGQDRPQVFETAAVAAADAEQTAAVAEAAETEQTNAVAQPASDTETPETQPEAEADNSAGWKALAAGIAIGLAAGAGAAGMGVAVAKTSEAIARQPEAEGKIRSTLMLGLVFIETAIIYALIVAILVIFVL